MLAIDLRVGKKLLILAAAIAVPGGLISLALAWYGSRPDVQEKLSTLWYRVSRTPRPTRDADPSTVIRLPRAQLVRPQAPVSPSRCRDTQVFRPLRVAA